jgi:hypothetical protein
VNSGSISVLKIHASGAVTEKLKLGPQLPRRKQLKLDLSPDDEAAYSFGFEYWTLNSWALDTGQWDRKYQHKKDMPLHAEEAYFDFTRPIKRFRAEIQLPDNSRVKEEPELIIRAFFLDNKGETHLSNPIKGIESYLNTSLTFSPERNVMLLAIDKPLCGYRYTIRWYLPEPSRMEKGEDYRLEVGDLITELWERRNLRQMFKPKMMAVDELIRRLFEDKLGKIIRPAETIDVMLAIPVPEEDQMNEQAASLEFISSNLDNHPILGKRLEIGDGTAGRAFKMNKIHEYRADRVDNDDPKSNIYVPMADYVHQVLYAIPLVHPMNKHQVIGILSIGSKKRNSGLLPKQHADEAEQKKRAILMLQIAKDYLLPSLEKECGVELSRP